MTDDRRSAGAPTLEDVARAAGVSRATVSRVINGVRNVDPAIQEVVRQAVSVTGYAPNRAARSLVTRRADAVALVVSGAGVEAEAEADVGAEAAAGVGAEAAAGSSAGRAGGDSRASAGGGGSFTAQVFADPFFGRVVTGVVDYLRPRGVHPVLMFAETSRARDEVVAYSAAGQRGRGPRRLHPRRGSAPRSAHGGGARRGGLRAPRPAGPHQLRRPRPPARCPAGRRTSAGPGCRRLATISGPLDVPAGRARLTGLRDTPARHGHAYIPVAEGRFTQDSGEAAMERLLVEHPDLDGVFAANDLMATGACHVLREHGRRVPEDVAVVGFDDRSAALACRPPLTTVRQPVEAMAAEMARLPLDRPPGRPSPATSVIFEPELVVRAST